LVAIRSIGSGQERYPASDGVKFSAGTKSIEIDYTALSLSVPERVQFRYRLEGVDSVWQEVSTRREAIYSNLGPGHYSFRVIACNNDGVWNEEGASLEFDIAPTFYQTKWFVLLCVAVAAFLLWAAYQWRVQLVAARLQMQFQERLSERTRIAQDLHDTLLQGLLSASMQLHVADDRLSSDSPAKPLVSRVLELMRQVVEEGRNAIQGLRSPGSDLRDLEQVFSRIKEELALFDTVEFKVVVEGVSRPLHPVIRDEAYRIGREALTNAFRHSQASRIEVQIEYTGKSLRILVQDNGGGIDPGVLRSGREGHWGLSGMRERAEEIGGKLRVLSRVGAGTEIELSIPSHVAFGSDNSGRKLRWLTKWHPRKANGDASRKRESK
jgi:signal transduction histidine kinase